MADDCMVVVAPPQLLDAVKARVRNMSTEIVAVVDTDMPGAIDTIMRRRPARVAIERLFSETSRGVALIARLNADPELTDVEIRIVSHDTDYWRVPPRPAISSGTSAVAVVTEAAALDNGTRRAKRVRIADGIDVLVDGAPARLFDLSPLGMQVVSGAVLKPNQRVRVTLVDERDTLRLPATVVWAAFELSKDSQGPRYRAGLEFHEVDEAAVVGFGRRHRKP
jgi:PilZ domain